MFEISWITIPTKTRVMVKGSLNLLQTASTTPEMNNIPTIIPTISGIEVGVVTNNTPCYVGIHPCTHLSVCEITGAVICELTVLLVKPPHR